MSYLMTQILVCAVMAYALGLCVGFLIIRVVSLVRKIRPPAKSVPDR